MAQRTNLDANLRSLDVVGLDWRDLFRVLERDGLADRLVGLAGGQLFRGFTIQLAIGAAAWRFGAVESVRGHVGDLYSDIVCYLDAISRGLWNHRSRETRIV